MGERRGEAWNDMESRTFCLPPFCLKLVAQRSNTGISVKVFSSINQLKPKVSNVTCIESEGFRLICRTADIHLQLSQLSSTKALELLHYRKLRVWLN